MSDIKPQKREKIGFLLENRHYRRLHLYLYFTTTIIGLLVYILFINIFSTKYVSVIIAAITVSLGIFLVFKREKIVKNISERIHEREIKKQREENKKGLVRTIKRIKPAYNTNHKVKIGTSNENKFNLKNKIKNKFETIKHKLGKKKEIEEDYIEIK